MRDNKDDVPEVTEEKAATGQDAPRRTKRSLGRRPLAEGNADDTRQDIRHHALRLFNEQGYAAVSVEDIAQRAGLTRATIYYHYRGKADIFLDCVLRTLHKAEAEMRRVLTREDLSIKENLARYIHLRGDDSVAHGLPDEVSESMVAESMPHLPPRYQGELLQGLQTLHEVSFHLMAEGVRRGEFRPLPPEVLDFAFWQLFQPTSYPRYDHISQKEMEKHLLSLFFEGTVQNTHPKHLRESSPEKKES